MKTSHHVVQKKFKLSKYQRNGDGFTEKARRIIYIINKL